jgi:glycosyltransferase involved in cell wall biosynthesis
VEEAGSQRQAALRVCLVIGQLGLGGTEKQVVLLAEGLRQRGVDVCVAVLTGDGPRGDALRAAGVPVVHLGLRPSPGWRVVPQFVAVLGRLTRHLRRFRPDVVHAFLFHSYVLGAPAARLAGVPAVIAGRRSLDDFTRGRPLALAVERIATALTQRLVANADAVAVRVRSTERVPDRKLSVIYNGLPPAAFEPAEAAELDTPHPVVLCVANLHSYKGHADLLAAAALLGDRGRPCTLALAGEGPQRVALRHLAGRLGIDVRLLGARTDVDRLLARADVVVLPSTTEGMSNAVMEAMAAGRPVVATAVGGTPELLAAGRGVLVAPGDPRALADALDEVLGDPAHAARLGRAAREWSRAHLSADTMVHRHLALYDELLER